MIDDGADSRNEANCDFADDKFKMANKIKIDFIKLKVNINSCAKRKLKVVDLADECERLMLESAMLQSELTSTNDAKLGQLFEFHEFVYKECISLLHDAKKQLSLVDSECSESGDGNEMFNISRQPVGTVSVRECAAASGLPPQSLLPQIISLLWYPKFLSMCPELIHQ